MGETTDVWILPHVEGWYQVGCAVCEFAAHEQDYAAAYEIADLHLGDHSPRPRTSSPWASATLGGCAAFLPGVGHDLLTVQRQVMEGYDAIAFGPDWEWLRHDPEVFVNWLHREMPELEDECWRGAPGLPRSRSSWIA